MRTVLAVLTLAAAAGPVAAQAQGTGFLSQVGIIDPAPLQNVLRTRYDSVAGITDPSRNEFLFARPAPLGPGLPKPETNIDYQEVALYGEVTLVEKILSGFVEMPVRFLNPTVNDNTSGIADVNFGAKVGVLTSGPLIATVQVRGYAPSGSAVRGLGTHHWSAEPGILLGSAMGPLTLEGEARVWIPMGETNFGGTTLRFGLGASYAGIGYAGVSITPVVEAVGWTVLGADKSGLTETAKGQTVLNANAGARFSLGGMSSVFAGYGIPLLGGRWYDHMLRVEVRIGF